MLVRILITIAAVAVCGASPTWAAANPPSPEPLAWHEVFRKAETWPETMLLCRARYRQWQETGPSDKALAAIDLAMRRIRLAGPEFALYEHRVTRDWAELPAVAPLDWFGGADAEIERRLIHLVLNRIEADCRIAKLATAPLRDRLAALAREDVDADDPRWLVLYCAVTDEEERLRPLGGVDTFRRSAELIRETFADERTYSLDVLEEELVELDRRWTSLLAEARAAPSDSAALVAEYAALRDRVRFGLRPVEEALAEFTLLDMRTEWEEQLTNLEAELRRRDWYRTPAVARQALRPAALILDSDRDPTDVVLRRTRALFDELRLTYGAEIGGMASHEARLSRLEQAAGAIPIRLRDARHALLFEVCRLRRCIAFQNPLLNFDQVLFVKRHFLRWGSGPAQKQYFGYRAHGGGSLCELKRPFAPSPEVIDLLAQSVCRRGRMEGRRLEGGDFVSPELSFDARTVFFAYTENSTAGNSAQFIDQERTLENTYHVFRVHADGSALEQLTDGPANDVDPTVLPNGRIAFVSERRGGCGRSAADRNYTLHGMTADGSDMIRLSHHETNEWQPSVDRRGMLLYTRWDIWDRGYFQAMNVWSTYPNGSDGRALFGNYYEGNEPCPNATMDVRSIPGSRKLMGTASSYFEQSYGALIVIDPAIPDDPQMTRLQRMTPEQPFAWREMSRYTGPLDYGTPWPLSDLFCLAVYDSDSAIRRGPENNYGLYLVDAFGNKELLYRDPEISCLSPIPMRPRQKPPIVSRYATGVVKAGFQTPTRGPEAVPMATVGLANVYRSYYPVPDGITIDKLRVVQVAYKSVIGRNIPVTGYGEDTGHDKGGRIVLGTAPVEDDGSAYFRMPAGVPVYFQAIADDRLAVQTMRSVTYAQPGERLLCLGCHEPQQAAPAPLAALPRAFRREPSDLQPDVDGSRPVTFPRLVQPVLDRHCADCHAEHPDEAPSLARGTKWKQYATKYYDDAQVKVVDSIPPERWAEEGYKYVWFDSYVNLYPFVRDACFVRHGPQEGARTKPGTFGARASRLLGLLNDGHYDVRLSDDEMHRIALWIDTNCRFFGPTRNLMRQAMGENVMPEIE
ncbi:hypothetical protein ACFL5Q_02510 [Planctomycetota bacterium]